MTPREMDKWVVGGGVVLVLCLFAGYVLWMNRGAFTRPSDIEFREPARAVLEARSLIAAKQRNPSAFGDFTRPEELPEPLRMSGMRYAKVHSDHVDLVLARNPDVSIGARIWAVGHRAHGDEPTRYRDVWFYRYCNEDPETLINIP